MTKPERATIVFYDEDTQQLKMCAVLRSHVQSAIDRAMVMSVPPDAQEHDSAPITDEDARKLGCMAILTQASVHLDLRARLKITTEQPVDWSPQVPPKDSRG